MKKTYFAPQAELICFAPVETIASKSKWELEKNSNSWTFFNHWGSLKPTTTETPVSGIMNWYDDLEKETINDLD